MKKPDAGDPRSLSAFERQLLESARREPLPAELKRRMANAFEPSAALSGMRPALRVARVGRMKLLATWIGPGIIAAGLAGWYALMHSSPRADASAQPSAAGSANVSPAAPANAAAPAQRPALGADSLADEIALLDRARAALRAGAHTTALRELAHYRERFAHGALSPEAEALQIEALLGSGAKLEGRRLGERFLSNHPEHPWASRVRQLLSAR